MASFKVSERLRILVFCRVGSFARYELVVHGRELFNNLRLQLQAMTRAFILFAAIKDRNLTFFILLWLPSFNRIIELILEEL